MHLVKLFGINIEMHWTLLLLFGLLLISGGGAATLTLTVLFASIILHELAHSLVARHFRVRVSKIVLLPLGGMSMIEEFAMPPKTELLVSLAGPALSLLLAAAAFAGTVLASSLSLTDAADFFGSAMEFNLVLGVFNLLPALPLDGGRVWRAFRQRSRSLVDATREAVQLSKFCVVLLMILGVGAVVFAGAWSLAFWNAIISAFILLSAQGELSAAVFKAASDGVHVRDCMHKNFLVARGSESIAEAFKLAYDAKTASLLLVSPQRIGVVSAESFAGVPRADWDTVQIRQLAIVPPRLRPADAALDAWKKMREAGAWLSPVVEKGKLVGIVTQEDVERQIHLRRLSLYP